MIGIAFPAGRIDREEIRMALTAAESISNGMGQAIRVRGNPPMPGALKQSFWRQKASFALLFAAFESNISMC